MICSLPNFYQILTFLFVLPYFIMIASGLLVPSDGNHGFLSIKTLSFLGTMGCVGLYLCIRRKFSMYQLRVFCFILFALIFLLLWLLISSVYGQTSWHSQVDQFKVFLITIAVTVITLYLVNEGLTTFQAILKTIVYANFLYSFLKILLVGLHLLHIIDMWKVVHALGVRFMSMGMYGEVARLQTSVDIITPFLIFFVLQSERLGCFFRPFFKKVYCVIAFCAIMLSFSRFLFAVAILSCILYWMTLHISQLAKSFILFFIAVFIAMALIGFDNVAIMVERRLFSSDNFQSDMARVEQMQALYKEHQSFSFFGKGLGGYAPSLIRDVELLHSYEVQWAAFLLQFGLIGVTLLLIPPGIISAKLIFAPFSRVRWAFFMLFVVWLLSGFTNPLLISLTSGIIYSLFLLSATQLNRELLE